MGELSGIVMQFPYAGLFLMPLLGCIGFPFPEDAVLLSCGFLISQRIIMPLPAFLVVYTAVMISDFFIYSLGKKYGRAVITHRRSRRLLPPEKLHFLESRFRKFGVLTFVIGRQIIGVRAQTILAAGVLDMPLRTFLLTDACAAFLTVLLLVSLGYMGIASLMANYPFAIDGGYMLGTVFLCAAIFYLVRLHIAKRRMRTDTRDLLAIGTRSC